MDYEDGLQFIYFYTGGSKGGTPQIKEMLQYLQNSSAQNATSDVLKKIHRYVSDIKINPEVEHEYMTFEDFIALERKDAAKEAGKKIRAASILELLEDYGPIPDSVREGVMAQDDSSVLKSWHKLAARSASIPDFAAKAGLKG